MRPWLPSFFVIFAVGTMTAAELPYDSVGEPLRARVAVNAADVRGKVNRRVFGSNLVAADDKDVYRDFTYLPAVRTGCGIWDDKTGRPVQGTVDIAREMGMSVIRYPGGNIAHKYLWKEYVGPLGKRGDHVFGLDEYLEWCRAVGGEPLITTADYVDTPESLAEMVQYLNAPAVAAHPWAMKRAAWGHKAPWGVKWFELGNETFADNHSKIKPEKWTPQQYIAWAKKCVTLMKAVDPTVKIGLVLAGDPFSEWNGWDKYVLTHGKDLADFWIIHYYTPNYGANLEGYDDLAMGACLAVGEQSRDFLQRNIAMIRQYTGESKPIALTEYNAKFTNRKPVDYLDSYGADFFCADYLRTLLEPANNILMANYWQYTHNMFRVLAMRKEKDGSRTLSSTSLRPLYRVWNASLGERIIGTDVTAPRLTFPGLCSARPCRGDRAVPSAPLKNSLVCRIGNLPRAVKEDGKVEFFLTREGKDFIVNIKLNAFSGRGYPEFRTIGIGEAFKKEFADQYTLSFDARYRFDDGPVPPLMGIGMSDVRGWSMTYSAIGIMIPEVTREWCHFEETYTPLPDIRAMNLVARLHVGPTPRTGLLQLRNVKITASHSPTYPAFAALTSFATVSADGRKLYLILFNKTLKRSVTAALEVKDFPGRPVRVQQVNAPKMTSVNFIPGQETVIADRLVELRPEGSGWTVTLPPHSMTAIEFERNNP